MLSGFPELIAEQSDGKYSVIASGQKITVYSERSGARDLAQIKAVLESTEKTQTLLIVAPYADALADLFKENRDFIFLAPVNFSENAPDDERLLTDDAKLEHFINRIGGDERFKIHAISQWQTMLPEIMQRTRKILERAALRLKTIVHFARLWQINFRINSPSLHRMQDISFLKTQVPDALVMAGPSLDAQIQDLKKFTQIWCADTAFPALLSQGIYPKVVFSVDAGFASREHFSGRAESLRHLKTILVCDVLGNPAVQRLPFTQKITYASSHPLVQQWLATERSDLTPLENPAGDVGSLMRIVYAKLFADKPVKVLGHDGKHLQYITHARATAYFSRCYFQQHRLFCAETYMFRLSNRYR